MTDSRLLRTTYQSVSVGRTTGSYEVTFSESFQNTKFSDRVTPTLDSSPRIFVLLGHIIGIGRGTERRPLYSSEERSFITSNSFDQSLTPWDVRSGPDTYLVDTLQFT